MSQRDVVLQLCLFGIILVTGQIGASDGFGSVIETTHGKVRGLRFGVHGKIVDAFLGIPFAKPPLGNLRFKNPIQPDPWQGILNVTKKPNACYQILDNMFPDHPGAQMWNANTKLSEDCLYLNVWAPEITKPIQRKKSVMIWIFGGGFYSGSSSLDVYDGRILAAENDVVVVSMQYRVGSLGFLSLFHRENLGNAGMFDQVMALEWVQQNIHQFGGDPHSVTLFGESAGAVSVGMHLLSPLSRGKFQRAILQSGAPHAAWAVLTNEEAQRRSLRLAELMKCNHTEEVDILSCLRSRNASSLIDNEWLTININVVRFPFVPMVDGAFLTEPPERSLMNNNFKKCPLLLGHNTNEANYWLIYDDQSFFPLGEDPKISQAQFDTKMDDIYRFHPYYPKKLNRFGLDAIRFFYRNWQNPDDQRMNAHQIDMAVGDFNFICPTVDLAQHYASTGNDVYYYLFDHRSSRHNWPAWSGVLHADEINFVFGEPLNATKGYTRDEKHFARKMMRYWTNFAKTGNPNKSPGTPDVDEWDKYDNKSRKHIILEASLLKRADKSRFTGEAARVKQCAFWKEYLPRLVVQSEEKCDGTAGTAGTQLTTSGSLTLLLASLVVALLTQ